MIIQCCACHRVREGDRWVPSQEADTEGRPVSYGYCPTCAAQAYAEIKKDRAHMKRFKLRRAGIR